LPPAAPPSWDKIGDGVAIIQGTMERPGEQPLRQSNQFFYLCGVVEPRAILVIDGKTKRTTVFLRPRNERQEKGMYGPGLYPSDENAKAIGVDAILPRDDFKAMLEGFGKENRVIYNAFRPEVLGSASPADPAAVARNTKADPWDGRSSREEQFRARLKEYAPNSEIKDMDAMIDTLRGTKSPREIAVIREATKAAGLGIMEAMRDARPGMHEYEIQADAEYVFQEDGVRMAPPTSR